MKRKSPPLWFVSIICFPLVTGGLVMSIQDVIQGRRSKSFSPVPAQILDSSTKSIGLGFHFLRVRYQYEVDNAPFVSSHIWPGQMLNALPVWKLNRTETVLKEIKNAGAASAYMNENDPTQVVLVPNPRRAWVWFFFFFGLFSFGVLAPLCGHFVALKQKSHLT